MILKAIYTCFFVFVSIISSILQAHEIKFNECSIKLTNEYEWAPASNSELLSDLTYTRLTNTNFSIVNVSSESHNYDNDDTELVDSFEHQLALFSVYFVANPNGRSGYNIAEIVQHSKVIAMYGVTAEDIHFMSADCFEPIAIERFSEAVHHSVLRQLSL
ncbi:hypothetical protein G3R49_01380 [Shewanella sp. WXL01]|uniref:hypothetical protein n=1 Tax=Shewanella sp. WXL01 TaxID=2709721 RepID=UPI0014384F97|nr:hypothetical protein [Shewanella sp. WXL01]NKF49229.1 hypothetical protein [Shewanella sp. WXL01]